VSCAALGAPGHVRVTVGTPDDHGALADALAAVGRHAAGGGPAG
jgi:hypothetical protein